MPGRRHFRAHFAALMLGACAANATFVGAVRAQAPPYRAGYDYGGANYPPPLVPPAPLPPADSATDAKAPSTTPEHVADAHADRVVVVPTAYTHPQGTVYFSSYDIALLAAGYALTDTAQITATATPPLGDDHIFPLDLTLKVAVLRASRVRAALLGSATGLVNFEQSNAFVGRAGGVVQLCVNESCDASVSMGTNLLLAGPALLLANGVGGIIPLAKWCALLLEFDTLLPMGPDVGEIHGIAIAPGVRFRGRTWGLDLAAARPLDVAGSPPAVPILAFTYRFLP